MMSSRLSSPAQTMSFLKSGVRIMPRGRAPVGMVLITFKLSLSMTVTVLSFSLDTKIVPA